MVDLEKKIAEIEQMWWDVAQPQSEVAKRSGISTETFRRMLSRRTTPLFHNVAKVHHTLRRMLKEAQCDDTS